MRFLKLPCLALSLLFGGCAHMEAAQPRQPVPLVLDVDTGRDDAWALLGAMRREELTLVISTYGNIPRDTATRNTLDIVGLGLHDLPAEQISAAERRIVIFEGEAAPLAPATPVAAAEIARRAATNGNGMVNVTVPHSDAEPANQGQDWAAEVRDRIIAIGRPVDYIAAGPLTNLSQLVDAFGLDDDGQPAIKRYINRVIVMGGSFEPGLAVDFNFKADPRAAQHVLETLGDRVTLVPFDETRKLRLTEQDILSLRAEGAPASLTREMMLAHARGWSQDRSILLHDPATLLALDGEGALTTERVRVEQSGDNAGKIIRDDVNGIAVQRFNVPQGAEQATRDLLLNRYLDLRF